MTFAPDRDSPRLPRAVLLDLDDTILDDSRNLSSCWRDACFAHASSLADMDPVVVFGEIERTRAWYWADAERHRLGRLRLADARRDVVRMSLTNLGLDLPDVADAIATHYQTAREQGIEPIEGAVETVRWLRDRGCRLALLTNGEGRAQRMKIDRFALAPLFDLIPSRGSWVSASRTRASTSWRSRSWSPIPTTRGWWETTSNGTSSRRRLWEFGESGSILMAGAFRTMRPSGPGGSSAASRRSRSRADAKSATVCPWSLGPCRPSVP
jgi:beta-phosphoglucomutase-like phosphatase (HAD superfamily)